MVEIVNDTQIELGEPAKITSREGAGLYSDMYRSFKIPELDVDSEIMCLTKEGLVYVGLFLQHELDSPEEAYRAVVEDSLAKSVIKGCLPQLIEHLEHVKQAGH